MTGSREHNKAKVAPTLMRAVTRSQLELRVCLAAAEKCRRKKRKKEITCSSEGKRCHLLFVRSGWPPSSCSEIVLLCFGAAPSTEPPQNEDICSLPGSAGTRRRCLGSRRQLADTCCSRLFWQVSAAPDAFDTTIWPGEGVAQVASCVASAAARSGSEREENRPEGEVQADRVLVLG